MAYYLKAPDGRELAYSSKEAAIAAMRRALKKYPDWKQSGFSLESDGDPDTNPKAERLRSEAAQLGAKADSIAKANSKPGLLEGLAGDIFPTAVERGADFGPWDAVTDAASYMLRAPSAMLDAANPYSTRTADNRYGIRESLEDSQKGRWGFDVPFIGRVSPGAILHGGLHDKMTPLMAMPGAGISKMLKPGASLGGKVVNGMLGGGASGLLTEALRPAMTDAEVDDDYLRNIMLGLGSGLALGGLMPLPGAAVSGLGRKLSASIPGRRVKLANASNVNPEALEVASTDHGLEMLRKYHRKEGELAQESAGLYDRFNLADNMPEAAEFNAALGRSPVQMDVYPIGREGRNVRRDMMRENESATLPPGTEAAVRRIEENAKFFDPRYDYEPYYGETMGEPSGRGFPVDDVRDFMLGKPTGSDLTGFVYEGDFIDPNHTQIVPFAPSKEARTRYTPKEFRSLSAIQKNKQAMQSLIGNKYSAVSEGRPKFEDVIYEQQARGLRRTLLDGLQQDGSPEALNAIDLLNRMALKNAHLQNFRKKLNLGKDADMLEQRAEVAFKNMFKKEDDVRQRNMRKATKLIDDDFGTDFYGRARYASFADDLAETGAKNFTLSTSNKWPNGRSTKFSSYVPLVGPYLDPFIQSAMGYTPKGAVRRLRGEQALADLMQGAGERMQNGYNPFYQRPASAPESRSSEKEKEKDTRLAGKLVSMLVNGGAQAVVLTPPTYKAKSVADLR